VELITAEIPPPPGPSSLAEITSIPGVSPYLGRFFRAADEKGTDSAPYVVLKLRLLAYLFSRRRRVIGRSVEINKHGFTILGVRNRISRHELFFAPAFWDSYRRAATVMGSNQLQYRGVTHSGR